MEASDLCTLNRMSALLLAALNGHIAVVNNLLDHGANLDLTTENGWTPLMFASQNGHKEVVRTLLSKGAQVNLKNKHNQTALMLAEEAKEYNVMYFLGTLNSISLSGKPTYSTPPPVYLSDKQTPPPVSLSDKPTFSTPPSVSLSDKPSSSSIMSRGNWSSDLITYPMCDEDNTKAERVQDSIFCAGKCATWLHRQCAGLSVSAFKLLDNSEEPYLCPNCELDAQKIERDDLKKQIADLKSVM